MSSLKLLYFSLLANLLVILAIAHPDPNTKYNWKCEQISNITFYSFHIHILFWQSDNTSTFTAFQLKKDFIKYFNIDENATCNDINTTHNESPDLCIVDVDYPLPFCPFPVSEWAAFIPPSNFSVTVQWIMANHRGLDIIIHPNSGCELYDHRDWFMSIGHTHVLNIDCLHWNSPGFDFFDCQSSANAIMFDNSDMNYYDYCGLIVDQESQLFAKPNGKNVIKFCSIICQSWITKAIQFTLDCPSNCDEWNDNSTKEELCEVYFNSMTDLNYWSISLCSYFG